MAIIDVINVSTPDDGLGDTLRDSQIKANTNFAELNVKKVEVAAGFGLSENNFTDAEKTKLQDIEEFAEVNVQADWLQEDSEQDDYIKNKPVVINDTIININGVEYDLTVDREWRTAQADTGVLTFECMTPNSGTTIDIGAVTGYIVDNETTPGVPAHIYVSYAGATGVVVTTVGSGLGSYVLLDDTGAIHFQNTFPTSAERKAKIWLGKVGHPDGTITTVINEPDYITSPQALTRDLFQGFGYINNGVFPYANGANLNMNVAGGVIIGDGINFVTSRESPNAISMGPNIATSFFYRTQTGGATGLVTAISPGFYDVAGTVTAVGGGAGASTIQYIWAIPGVGYIVTYGQTVYTSLVDAISAVGKEDIVIYPNLANNTILIGALAVNKTATALNNTAQARFFRANKLGEIGGATAGTSVTTLQAAYNNSVQPQISPDDTLGAFQLKNGRASNTSAVFEVKNIASSLTASITGDGTFTGIGFVKAGGISTDMLMANGTVKSDLTLITITSSISITTATTDSNGVGQDGRHVVIENGANAINLTCNGGVTTSYGKAGTAAITFIQGSGRTLVQLSGTAVLSGIAGSKASVWSNGTTDYLEILNY
jgi:hypothetical protein